MPTLTAFDYLARPPKSVPPLVVLFGDELYLRRLVLKDLRERLLGAGDAEFSCSVFEGDKAQWRDVHDELAMLALFGGTRRLIVVENADAFVTQCRESLEAWLARPVGKNILILDVDSWPKSTRLYKAVEAIGLPIDCALPPAPRLCKWLINRASEQYGAKLPADAAELLVELSGDELGLLDQELAKLAAFAGQGATVTAEMVQRMVGGWRTRTVWEMIDAAAGGDARTALAHLDKLLAAGEQPYATLGSIGWALRQFASAALLVEQAEVQNRRITLAEALTRAGVRHFKLSVAEQQLRQIGRKRALQLFRWILAADLDLKGRSQLPPRMVLERLIVRLSRQAQAFA